MLDILLSLFCFHQRRTRLSSVSSEHTVDSYQCDEKRPVCTNCANHEVECTFSVCESPEILPTKPNRSQNKAYRFRSSKYSTKISNPTPKPPALETTGTQCDDTSTNPKIDTISMPDLQLFHHFLVFTAPTIVEDVHGCGLWQNHVAQWAIEFPSILHLILALSALHLSHEKPDLRSQYLQQADNHFTFGVQSVTALLSGLNEDTCQKVYLSAVLVCLTYFGRGPRPGEYLVFSDKGPAEWLVLMHGVRLVLQSYHEKVFSGILKPIVNHEVPVLSGPLRSEMQEHMAQVQKLQHLLDLHHPWDAADRVMYISAIDNLTSMLEEVYGKRALQTPGVGFMHVLMGWVYRLPREFVAQLEQKEPLALVIFAHWADLLKSMESVWFMKSWAEHVLNGVCAFLPADLWEWIEWPMQHVYMEV